MTWFTQYFYQPFFNILVGIYWVLSQINIEFADMGIAVILFAIVVKILTLPLTIASERSEEEKREIVSKVEKIKQEYSHDPIMTKNLIKKIMRTNKRVVISTTTNLFIQLGIIIMLYRIFATGLDGQDFHLLYGFMPNVQHVNLMFLGKFDLTHTNPTLNLLQSAMIFVVEILLAIRSPFRLAKKDIALTQIILPFGSYVIFMFLPAGKKLFVITSLAFSAMYSIVRIVQRWMKAISKKFNAPTQEVTAESPPPQR